MHLTIFDNRIHLDVKGCEMISFKLLMAMKALLSVLVGIPVLVAPRFFFGFMGVTVSPEGIMPVWQYGASVIGNALVTWFGRDAKESKARRAIIMGMVAYNGIGFIVVMIATLTGVTNLLGWLGAAVYLFFTVGFGYYWLKPPTP